MSGPNYWNEVCGWEIKYPQPYVCEPVEFVIPDVSTFSIEDARFTPLTSIQEFETRLPEMLRVPAFYSVSFPMASGKSTEIPPIVSDASGKDVWVFVPTGATADALVGYVREKNGWSHDDIGVYPSEARIVYVDVQKYIEDCIHEEVKFDEEIVYIVDEMHSADCAVRAVMALLAEERRMVIGMTASYGMGASTNSRVHRKEFDSLQVALKALEGTDVSTVLEIGCGRPIVAGAKWRGATHAIGRTYGEISCVLDTGQRATIVRRKGRFSYRVRGATAVELNQMAGRVGRVGPGKALLVKNKIRLNDAMDVVVAVLLAAIVFRSDLSRYWLYRVSQDLGAPMSDIEGGDKCGDNDDDGKSSVDTLVGQMETVGLKRVKSSFAESMVIARKLSSWSTRDCNTIPIDIRVFPDRNVLSLAEVAMAKSVLSGVVAPDYTKEEYTLVGNYLAHVEELGLLQGNYKLVQASGSYRRACALRYSAFEGRGEVLSSQGRVYNQ